MQNEEIKAIANYSQNDEQIHILEYFKDKPKGQVLDIGANDGKTFSNSLALIEKGWMGVLVEPSPKCCEKLHALHKTNRVAICPFAIGKVSGKFVFNESGELIDKGMPEGNSSLVSTLVDAEMARWARLGMPWQKIDVDVLCWADFRKGFPNDKFDFITIDAEGVDFEILSQIDLKEVGCQLICVEHNGNKEMLFKIIQHCASFGVGRLIYTSGENVILGI